MDYSTTEVRLLLCCLYMQCTTFLKMIIFADIMSGMMVTTLGILLHLDFFSFNHTFVQQIDLINYYSYAFMSLGGLYISLGIFLFILEIKIQLPQWAKSYSIIRNLLTTLQFFGFAYILIFVLSFYDPTYKTLAPMSSKFGGFSDKNPSNFQVLVKRNFKNIMVVINIGIVESLYGYFINWLIKESFPIVDEDLKRSVQQIPAMSKEIIRKKFRLSKVVPEGQSMANAYNQPTLDKQLADNDSNNSKVNPTEVAEEKIVASKFRPRSPKRKTSVHQLIEPEDPYSKW